MTCPSVVVAGALANKAGNGGEAWVRMSWVTGLMQLGFDVWFVEELSGAPAGVDVVAAEVAWFKAVTTSFGIRHRAVLVRTNERGWDVEPAASADVDLPDVLRDASLLVNISGNLRHPSLLGLARRAAYVDLDPGFTQIWAARGVQGLALERHDLHFTVGELIGTSRCPLPTAGHRWLPCRQPVVLDDWPPTAQVDGASFTTVATWRCPFGTVEWAGTSYDLKLHEFRKVSALPASSPVGLELALDIHPADDADRQRLVAHGWSVRASDVAASPDAFRAYVQASAGEFAVAQGVYTANTGWFSDRTVRYLATGRPVVVQDTGWGEGLELDGGLVTFVDLAGARSAIETVSADLDRHSKVARALAEEHFAADVVLRRFLSVAVP